MTSRQATTFRPLLALLLVCTMLILLLAWIGAHTAHSVHGAEAGQTIPNLPATILLTKTVGTDYASCSPYSSLLVPPETVVYYCYRVRNTSDSILTHHQLFDDDFDEAIIPDGFRYDLQPDETIDTVEMGFVATRTITRSITNFASWEAYVDDNLFALDTATATVTVRTPQVTLEVRVGAGDGCAGSASYVGDSGDDYSWCVKLANTGEITLTNHTLTMPAIGVTISRTVPLAPGASATWTRSDAPALGPFLLTGDLNVAATVTSSHTEIGVPFIATASTAAGVFLYDESDSRGYLPQVSAP